jgi:phage/plasmid-like protein (TIGR03299 family)
MAHITKDSQVWFPHGTNTPNTNDLSDWAKFGDMDWNCLSSPVQYMDQIGMVHQFDDQVVLYRDDTFHPLSTVSKKYKIHQPLETLNFFKEFIEHNGFKMYTAGAIDSGRKFFAQAKIGKNGFVVDGDEIEGYLSIISSLDSSTSTLVSISAKRLFCTNQMGSILRENAKHAVRITHKQEFDPYQIKLDMKLIDSAWDNFIHDMRKLANTTVSDKIARNLYQDVVFNKNISADEQSTQAIKKVDEMMRLYKHGAGSSHHYGTAYGVYNGFTDYYTNGGNSRSPDSKFLMAHYGSNSAKLEFQSKLLEMA